MAIISYKSIITNKVSLYIPFIMILNYGLNQLLIFLIAYSNTCSTQIIHSKKRLFANCLLFMKMLTAVCMVRIIPLSTFTSHFTSIKNSNIKVQIWMSLFVSNIMDVKCFLVIELHTNSYEVYNSLRFHPTQRIWYTFTELYCKIYNLFTFSSKRSKAYLSSSFFRNICWKWKQFLQMVAKSASMFYLKANL